MGGAWSLTAVLQAVGAEVASTQSEPAAAQHGVWPEDRRTLLTGSAGTGQRVGRNVAKDVPAWRDELADELCASGACKAQGVAHLVGLLQQASGRKQGAEAA
jgi:hypothetical protein